MIIESGVIVAGGLLLTFAKCNWQVKMWMLSNPVFMDILVFCILFLLHAGTFSGVMVATVGAFLTSGMLSAGRFTYGYMENGQYIPGKIDVSHHLVKEDKASWFERSFSKIKSHIS